MTACTRGCTHQNEHTTTCGCHDTCPNHDNHCRGCLPRNADIGHYCRRCALDLRDTIDTIPTLINTLHQLPDGRLAPPPANNSGDPTRRATKVDQHSPSPAHDAANEATMWLYSWAIAVADERSERGPFEYRRDGIPEPHPAAEARYLTSRLEHITAQSYTLTLNEEAVALVATMTRITGLDNADQRIPTRCPHCNQRTLVRPDGQDHVICRNRHCGNVWQSAHLGLLAREATA